MDYYLTELNLKGIVLEQVA